MKQNLSACLFYGDSYFEYAKCIAFSLEREAYTPYDEITASFIADSDLTQNINRIGIFLDDTRIFLGLVDNIQLYYKNNIKFMKIHSKSFTSLLTQNELASGLHSNLTLQNLIEDFYDFPYITYDNLSETGYIFVKSGNTMWDGIVSFVYKITGRYPYVNQNHICVFTPQDSFSTEFHKNQILEYGTVQDYSKLVSHYHMSDLLNNPNVYQQENNLATNAKITRHKYIDFDDSFRHAPEMALTFRNLYSRRGCQAKYLVYNGFGNEQIGHKITFQDFLQNQTVCRIRTTFGTQGFKTKLWCYQDGFYNN
ncbi:MAG: hypothetical protein K2J88_01215 [Oscillospiraceae bacterium]|nr:hypothetical protein [Oscillospiraceae bacterium]